MSEACDCLVIGGGPAGSTVATLVAEAGLKTILLEREKFPRFHVGESLMPEAYWVFQRLGVLDKMRNSPFVKKVSVSFVSHSGKQSQPFPFREHDPRECSSTWQVERSEFDQLLFENAAEKGADCRDGCRVTEVLFDGQRAIGARVASAEGSRRIDAQVVVDASGQQTLIANSLGLKRINPDLKKSAIWTYYRDARRDPGEHAGATVILHTRHKETWFWFIPLQNDVTSIGVVGDNDLLLKNRGTPEDVFEQEMQQCPALTERLASAERVDKHHVAREFSYSTEQAAGDGWVLVGDAWGFIDPIYSSGVYFALKSGELAADCIIEGLRSGDTSGAQLGGWAPQFAAATKWIRKLVDAFYTKDFSFGQFMQQHPRHLGNLTDLLIGRIFHPEAGRIFDDMEPELRRCGPAGQKSAAL